ncbi:DUF4160 domain-containing protein [Edwardsiella ictaluri]|uniref:DUF4160 domain-containing protein n=1 Tax=Edwardsiella ictaluri TaxID=67780 RepID=UPI0018C8C538
MGPAVYNEKGFRFYFFSSREEQKTHIHVVGKVGEAKFWIKNQPPALTVQSLT